MHLTKVLLTTKEKTSCVLQYLPVDPSPIEGFHIFYKPFDSAEDFENITLIGAGIRNHLLTDLKPDTEYTIKMQCFNTAGVSDFSNTVVKRTLRKH